jgi:hypothetical protein
MDKDGRRKIMAKARKKYKIDMFLFMISWKENFPLYFMYFHISNLFEWKRKAKNIPI